MENMLSTQLKDALKAAPEYFLDVQPSTFCRITQGDRWIFASTDKYLQDYDKRKGSRTYDRKMQMVRANEYKKEVAWKINRSGFNFKDGCYIIVFMRHMPRTWRKGKRKPCKRDLMAWQPMKQRPDIDNFFKALSDSILKEDKDVWAATMMKIWIPDECQEGTLFIKIPELFSNIVAHIKERVA